MPALPVLSGDQTVRALEKAGFEFSRQRGSHVVLRRVTAPNIKVTVPRHKELKPGTLRAIIRAADLTTEEFTALVT